MAVAAAGAGRHSRAAHTPHQAPAEACRSRSAAPERRGSRRGRGLARLAAHTNSILRGLHCLLDVRHMSHWDLGKPVELTFSGMQVSFFYRPYHALALLYMHRICNNLPALHSAPQHLEAQPQEQVLVRF